MGPPLSDPQPVYTCHRPPWAHAKSVYRFHMRFSALHTTAGAHYTHSNCYRVSDTTATCIRTHNVRYFFKYGRCTRERTQASVTAPQTRLTAHLLRRHGRKPPAHQPRPTWSYRGELSTRTVAPEMH